MPVDTIEFLKARGPQLLGTREAAALLGCHTETLYKIVKKGYLRHIRVGGRMKFNPADLIGFLEQRTV